MDVLCRETQKKIDAYINESLSGDELKDFVFHVKNCDVCMEELKINYSLLKALEQLEKGDELSENYDEEVEEGLNNYIARRKRGFVLRIVSYVSIFIISVIFGVIFCVLFVKDDNTKFLDKGENESMIIDVDGVPDYLNEIKKINNTYNDMIIEYIHSIKLENER